MIYQVRYKDFLNPALTWKPSCASSFCFQVKFGVDVYPIRDGVGSGRISDSEKQQLLLQLNLVPQKNSPGAMNPSLYG